MSPQAADPGAGVVFTGGLYAGSALVLGQALQPATIRVCAAIEGMRPGRCGMKGEANSAPGLDGEDGLEAHLHIMSQRYEEVLRPALAASRQSG